MATRATITTIMRANGKPAFRVDITRASRRLPNVPPEDVCSRTFERFVCDAIDWARSWAVTEKNITLDGNAVTEVFSG